MKNRITILAFAFFAAAGGYVLTQNSMDVDLTSEAQASTDAAGVQSLLCPDGTLAGYMTAGTWTLTVPTNGSGTLGNYSVASPTTNFMVDGVAAATSSVVYSAGIKDKVVIKTDDMPWKYTGMQCSVNNTVAISAKATVTSGLGVGYAEITAAADILGNTLTGTATDLYKVTSGLIAAQPLIDGIQNNGTDADADDLDATVDGSIRAGRNASLRLEVDVNDFDTPGAPGLQSTVTHEGTIS